MATFLAVEYSADVLFGLQYKGVGEKSFDAEEAAQKDPREIEMVILKNRNGRKGKTIELEYFPMFNYFRERKDDGNARMDKRERKKT